MSQRTGAEGSLGQRMRRALERRRRPGPIQPSKTFRRSLMMNPLRRAIFSELSNRPGLPSGELARTLRTSRANINWHLDKLVRARFLSRIKLGGRWAYFPTNLLSDEELPLFSVLGNPVTKMGYLAVCQRPGASQDKLSKALGLSRQDLMWHLGKLSVAGLITTVLDGRFRRYSPSSLFDERAREHAKRIGRFKGALLSALKEDGTSPSIIKSLSSSLLLRMASGEGSCVLEVVTDPYYYILKPRESAKKLTRQEK